MRKLLGFYTDEHGKVRPITAKTGKRRVKVKLVRSAHAVNVDRALKAPVAKSAEQWYKQPNRYDLPGADTPEDKAKSLNTPNDKVINGEKMNEIKIPYKEGETWETQQKIAEIIRDLEVGEQVKLILGERYIDFAKYIFPRLQTHYDCEIINIDHVNQTITIKKLGK